MRTAAILMATWTASCAGAAPRPQEVSIAPVPAPSATPAPPPPLPPAVRTGPRTVRVDQTVRLDDSEWVIVEARDAGKELESNSEYDTEKKTTAGRFIQVHFKITNLTKKEQMLLDRPKVRDASGREFGTIDMESFYVPAQAKTIALDTLQPNLTKDYWTVIEVAPDAERLEFMIHGFSLLADKHAVPLGL